MPVRSLLRTLSLLLVAVLAACTTTGVTPPPAPPADVTLDGTIAGWGLGDAAVAAAFESAAETPVATGTLDQRGELRVTLPGEIPSDALRPVASCPGLVRSDPGALVNSLAELEVRVGGLATGTLAKTSSREVLEGGLQRQGDHRRQYTYADRAVALTGECPFDAVGITLRYDLELERGWNEVVFTLDRVSPTGALLLSVTAASADAGAWHYAGPGGR